MTRAGMPLTNECKVTYTEVSPPSRLAYKTLADFVPGVAPYEVATVVELKETTDGVKLTITFDAMHDDVWTERARAGHESQMRKLDALLAAQGKGVRHAWILAGIGLVAGLAGVVAYYTMGGAELGPAWYAISIPVEAIPCVWLGGRLAASRRSSAHASELDP